MAAVAKDRPEDTFKEVVRLVVELFAPVLEGVSEGRADELVHVVVGEGGFQQGQPCLYTLDGQRTLDELVSLPQFGDVEHLHPLLQ